MSKFRTGIVAVIVMAAFAVRLVMQLAFADERYLSQDEANELGMKVRLVTPKPKVVYATLSCSDVLEEAQLVIQNSKGEWIANTAMAIKDKTCSAYIGEEYLSRSYFLVITKASDVYHVPLR